MEAEAHATPASVEEVDEQVGRTERLASLTARFAHISSRRAAARSRDAKPVLFRRELEGRLGIPQPCPECATVGKVRYVDVIRRRMALDCRACNTSWEENERDLARRGTITVEVRGGVLSEVGYGDRAWRSRR